MAEKDVVAQADTAGAQEAKGALGRFTRRVYEKFWEDVAPKAVAKLLFAVALFLLVTLYAGIKRYVPPTTMPTTTPATTMPTINKASGVELIEKWLE